ncbi:MAG TPA: ADP-forming succinate--CoA ligase subunit beta [Candidatus Polarisedimenticolaceae bacterium]|nr:ADP-forming succinate--CoA ligase subunit beta [Candidatus Polarisedimenticolaceae bacterium]
MKIHEYQAKGVLRRFGVPVPRGEAVTSAEDARRVAQELGGGTVVVKAQIHAGGRGKGTFRDAEGRPVLRPDGSKPLGGVVVVSGPDQAQAVAARMLGNVLVTKQSGPEGREVRRVLVEEGMRIAREVYLALLVDRAAGGPVFIASAEGGTEIEEVAAARPEAILKVLVDPRAGYSPWMGRRLAFGLGFAGEQVGAVGKLVASLHAAFTGTDASLVEINPLVALADGRVLALDAKVSFDDSALFRHPELRDLRDLSEEDPLEVEAGKHGLNYIKLDGNVACMVNGAGLAMGTMDIIQHHGGRPANFLDVGGGANQEMVTAAFKILLADPAVRAVLINIFGGIMRCDVVAEGVVAAARTVGVKVPVVVRLEGTNVERGREILRDSGLSFLVADGMKDAAEKVVAAAAGR